MRYGISIVFLLTASHKAFLGYMKPYGKISEKKLPPLGFELTTTRFCIRFRRTEEEAVRLRRMASRHSDSGAYD